MKGAPVQIIVNGIHPALIDGPTACRALTTNRWTLVRMIRAGHFRVVPWGVGKGKQGLRNMKLVTADVEAYINSRAAHGAADLSRLFDGRKQPRLKEAAA